MSSTGPLAQRAKKGGPRRTRIQSTGCAGGDKQENQRTLFFGRSSENLRGSVHPDGAERLALAGPRRWAAQAAFVVFRDLVWMGDELAAAFRAFRHGQHAVVDELDEPPGARHRQQRLEALRRRLLLVELVRLDDGVDLVHLGGLVQVLVDVEKERGVD